MKRSAVIFILVILFAGCASRQAKVFKSEKERTAAILEMIGESDLSDSEKKIITAEIKAKDTIIEAQDVAISKAESKTEAAESKADKVKEQVRSYAVEAGYGRVLKWIIGLGIAGVILFIVFKIARKFSWL